MSADYILARCSDDEIEESQNRKRPYYPASPEYGVPESDESSRNSTDYSQFTFGELVDEIRSLKRANAELKEENQMLRDRNIQVYRYKTAMLERVAKFEAFVEWAKKN